MTDSEFTNKTPGPQFFREYGPSPSMRRRAIGMMRRRGTSYKQAVQVVGVTCGVHAGLAYDEERYLVTECLDDLQTVERQHLESSLATAFCAMQRSFNAAERQGQWLECLRLAKEIDRLNGVSVDKRMEDR